MTSAPPSTLKSDFGINNQIFYFNLNIEIKFFLNREKYPTISRWTDVLLACVDAAVSICHDHKKMSQL